MDEESEIFKKKIRAAIRLSDMKKAGELTDAYAQHLCDYGQKILAEANEMEEEARFEDYFDNTQIVAEFLRVKTQLYFAEYRRIIRGQEEGLIPTGLENVRGLEELANRSDLI